jgi:hypothetical protein
VEGRGPPCRFADRDMSEGSLVPPKQPGGHGKSFRVSNGPAHGEGALTVTSDPLIPSPDVRSAGQPRRLQLSATTPAPGGRDRIQHAAPSAGSHGFCWARDPDAFHDLGVLSRLLPRVLNSRGQHQGRYTCKDQPHPGPRKSAADGRRKPAVQYGSHERYESDEHSNHGGSEGFRMPDFGVGSGCQSFPPVREVHD